MYCFDSPDVMPAGYPLANAYPACWTRWWVGTKCGEFLSIQKRLICFSQTKIRTRHNSDQDSDNELYMSKLSPFVIQKGFLAIAGTLKKTSRD